MLATCRGPTNSSSGTSKRYGSYASNKASSRISAGRCCRATTTTFWLCLALIASCGLAAEACSHHASGPADKCSTPPPVSLSAGAAADAVDDQISIVYQEVSEADLIAAAHQRQLLSSQLPPIDTDDEEAEEEAPTVQRPLRRCGAKDMSAEERSQVSLHLEHHKARQAVHQRARLSSMATAAALPAQRTSLNIPLYFHVITGKKKNSTVDASQELLLKQLQAMNDAYGRYSIRFDLKGITRVQSEAWAIAEINSPEETRMKSKLRKGGLGDLNIYVIKPASGTLGWSTFPWEAIKLGESFDGVLVHVGTMPGGNMKPYNKGYTMVHEVGHWLGLLHVFENGCDTPGDSVDDTAPQASAAYGCPLTRHTCPGNPVSDPVTNYMGYTDDACMTAFTRGQADRVLAMWDIYRAQNAQQNIIAEKSLSSAGSQQQKGTGKQTVKKQQGSNGSQQQGGVVLLEQGTQQQNADAEPPQQQVESVQYTAEPPPVDPAAAFAAKQAAAAPAVGSGAALDRRVPGKQQRSAPAASSKPRWSSLLSGPSHLVAFNSPGAVLEANAQVKKAQEQQQQQQQQQQQKQQQKHKSKHKSHKNGWASWLVGRPPPAASDPAAAAAPTAAHIKSVPYEHLQPEMGQLAAQELPASPGVPTLHPWSQPQATQQQFQIQYAQQAHTYQQYPQDTMLPPGYTGPMAPQYLVGAPPQAGATAASNQAALLAAMGGVPEYAAAPGYDSLAGGRVGTAAAAAAAAPAAPTAGAGAAPAAAATPPTPPDKHGRARSHKKKSKSSKGL